MQACSDLVDDQIKKVEKLENSKFQKYNPIKAMDYPGMDKDGQEMY